MVSLRENFVSSGGRGTWGKNFSDLLFLRVENPGRKNLRVGLIRIPSETWCRLRVWDPGYLKQTPIYLCSLSNNNSMDICSH